MKIGRYQIQEEIGRGAMGIVYRAHDPQIDRNVALKILRKDRVTSENLLKRFLKEARAIGRLSHPNIVTVFDAGQDPDGIIYITEEYLEGRSLEQVLKDGPLDLERVVEIGVCLSQAVHYAHEKGIVHRDLKPSNVHVTDTGHIKIMDFGIAHVDDPDATQQTQAGEIMGTPAYIAPELLQGQKVDGRSDLYAIGIILYELLTGKRPFKGATMAEIFRSIIQDQPELPDHLNASIPQSLCQVILKCLQKDPRARYQNGNALATALNESIAGNMPFAPVTEYKAPPTDRSPTHRIFLWTLMVLLFLATAVGIGYFSMPDSTAPVTAAPKVNVSIKAVLNVDSDPPGARLFIGGEAKGYTPVLLSVQPGDYRIRLTMEGHYDWEQDISVDQSGNQPLKAKLRPIVF